jgi:protein involved in polysaccharide export with SLBB domain
MPRADPRGLVAPGTGGYVRSLPPPAPAPGPRTATRIDMRRALLLLLAAVLLVPSAPATAQTEPAPAAVIAADPGNGELTLNPGDLIRVQVYREQELNGDFLVDEAGVAVLPLIGERRVVGIPLRRLRQELVEAYQQHLRNPSISITPLRRVNVLGEVQRPGMYPLDPTVSLAGAIATAGGATSTGNLNRIRIVRDGQILRQRVGAAETLNAVDVRSGDQIILERRSWVDRNSTFIVSAILSVTSIATSIILNR